MVSGFDFGIFYDCHNPQAAILFVVAVIFLNLLVRIMTDSWSKVSPLPFLLLCESAEMAVRDLLALTDAEASTSTSIADKAADYADQTGERERGLEVLMQQSRSD